MGFRALGFRAVFWVRALQFWVLALWVLVVWSSMPEDVPHSYRLHYLLGGSWDLVTRVIIKVTILISTYNPT